jgi:hypothetical protein
VRSGGDQAPAPASVSPPSPATPVSGEPFLKLEAAIEGKTPLYPGERLRFIYRFFFRGNIELTQEVLPLLDAEGFLKIGDKEIKDYVKDQMNVNEISQTYQALKPGDYSFGPSIVAGHSYQEDARGNRVYSKEVLKSEAPAVKITVNPFPEKDKPASFSGAIGRFTFDVSLKSPSEINVGDEMTLIVDIAGEKNLHTAALPEICCQPGFEGFFRVSDLPPTSEIHGNIKTFTVHLRPLTDIIKEIPSVEFSFFDPSTNKYTVLTSKPIPITVKPSKALPVEDLDKEKQSMIPLESKKEFKPVLPGAIEIQTNFLLHARDLYNKAFGTWWTMLVIPLGIAFLIYQNNLRHSVLKKKMEAKPVKSTDLFERAFLEQTPTSLFFALLNKAFKQALVEVKEIPQADISTEDLPQVGLSKEVRLFLSSIDEKRFSGQGNMSPTFLQSPAQALFEKIQKSIEENRHADKPI